MADTSEMVIVRFGFTSKKGFTDDKTKILSDSSTIATLRTKGKKLASKGDSLDRISIDFED